ncbi:hypothetical protein VTN77DRAFT_5925 [Rasamsonia byssochlamydoides]|uniref:uncharacterized protein n=1 Tax=Rasamsonia byssochlamydoides TaxID=89139 RepID=UPI0037421837
MPTLQNLICQVEQADTKPFTEYATTYGDRVVESYIAIPPGSTPFAISLKSNCFISEGLSMFVFIDGLYQCNRNRCDIALPEPCAIASGTPQRGTSVEFRVRQKEEYLPTGECVGKAWCFAPLNTLNTISCASPKQSSHSNHLGSIEVYVLRCLHRKNSQESLFDTISDGSISPESATSPLGCGPWVSQNTRGATIGVRNKIQSLHEEPIPYVGSKLELASRRTTLDGSKDRAISGPEYNYGKGEYDCREEVIIAALSPPTRPSECSIDCTTAQGTLKVCRHDRDLRQREQHSMSLPDERDIGSPKLKQKPPVAQCDIDRSVVQSSMRTSADLHSFETTLVRASICKYASSRTLNTTSADIVQYSEELTAHSDIEDYCYIISPNLQIRPTGQWHHHDSLNSGYPGRESSRANSIQGLWSETKDQRSSTFKESRRSQRHMAWTAKSNGESIPVEFHKGQSHDHCPHGHRGEKASQSEKNGSSPTKTDGEWDTPEEEEKQNSGPREGDKSKGSNTDNENKIENEWEAEYAEIQDSSKTQDRWENGTKINTPHLIDDTPLHDTGKRSKVDDQHDIEIETWVSPRSSGTPGDRIPSDRRPWNSTRSAEEVRSYRGFPGTNQGNDDRYGMMSPERIEILSRHHEHEPPLNRGRGLRGQGNLPFQPPHLTSPTSKDSPGFGLFSNEQAHSSRRFSFSSHIPDSHLPSHHVQFGSAERYIHNTENPKYIDSLQEPFAKFIFKYREKGIIEKIFGTEDKRDITKESRELGVLSKTELIGRLLHAEGLLKGQGFIGNSHHKGDMHASCKTDEVEFKRSDSLSSMRTCDPSSSDPRASVLGDTHGLHTSSPQISRQAGEQPFLNDRGMNIKDSNLGDRGTPDNRGAEWAVNHSDQQMVREPDEIEKRGQNTGDNTKNGGRSWQREVTKDKAQW